MALLPILEFPDPRLRTKAALVEAAEVTTPAFQQLIDDMLQTMYDAPGIGPIQAIRQSFAMMKKNFFRYILLLLSFLGLEILASCSCAIGFLWVMPYMQITMAAFYQERKDVLYPASEPVGYDTDSFGSGTDL